MPGPKKLRYREGDNWDQLNVTIPIDLKGRIRNVADAKGQSITEYVTEVLATAVSQAELRMR